MKLRLAAVLAGGATVFAGLSLGWLYLSARHVPAFYGQALRAERADLQHGSDRMLENAAALASNVGRAGRWHALFTAEQINGWLAVDAAQDFPELLPAGIAEPRIALHAGRIQLACRYLEGPVETVLSIDGEAYMQEPNVLSLRIHQARAGSLPLPLGNVLAAVSRAAAEAGLSIRWLQADGDPVALIRLHPARDSADNAYRLEALELREGELYVAGHTLHDSEGASEPLASADGADQAKTR